MDQITNETRKLQIQIHLAEYSALRTEMLSLIKWRDSLVFISLSISGAIFSFVFAKQQEQNINEISRWSALYIIAPLSSLVGGLWMVNSWRIVRIGNYLDEVISRKVNSLLNTSLSTSKYLPEMQVLGWESSNHRIKFKWERRLIEWLIYLITFAISGILSQILILQKTTGSLQSRLSKLDFPSLYYINSMLVISSTFLFLHYLLMGFRYRKKSSIKSS